MKSSVGAQRAASNVFRNDQHSQPLIPTFAQSYIEYEIVAIDKAARPKPSRMVLPRSSPAPNAPPVTNKPTR